MGWERCNGWANCSKDAKIEEGLGTEATISSNCAVPEMRGLHRFLFQNGLHQIWECWKRLIWSEALPGAEFRFELPRVVQLSPVKTSLHVKPVKIWTAFKPVKHDMLFRENLGPGNLRRSVTINMRIWRNLTCLSIALFSNQSKV